MALFHTLVTALCINCCIFAHALPSEKFSFLIDSVPDDGENYIVFDDTPGLGRQFEGIGAISGGGATSKLLVNYPKKQRDEILDYLFKPNFGASLQIFKVEIGGDAQSTDGTEASHMHEKGDENYQRGYEWWLMREAKKRNPNIKLYCLPWGFPGWLGQGTHNPYVNPQLTADYVVSWILGAKKVYNLTIDYVGIWNEKPYDVTYIKTLRKTLDRQGFTKTLIIAPDGSWDISADILKDQELASGIHAIGCHYPGTFSTTEARMTEKSLWASEDYSTYNDEVGGGCWARILNQNYVNGLMTSTISWNLVASYYNYLPFYRDGLMTAVEPWSGNYNVSTPIWMTAHTTQFVDIGWRYLSHDTGVGKLPDGGSYVSLTDAASGELTIIIETMSHDHSKCIRPSLPPYKVSPQTMTIFLEGSFAAVETMDVWYSKLAFDGTENIMFQKKQPLTFTDGKAQLSLGVDEIYTLSTIKTGNKGAHPNPPQSSPFPQVVADMFDEYPEYVEPNYLAPQVGSLEVRNVSGKRVARQTVLQRPVYWCNAETADKTISVIGDFDWPEMRFTVKFSIPANNGTFGVFVAVRVDRGGCQVQNAQGIFFFVFPTTRKFIVSSDFARKNVLKEGWLSSSTTGEHVIFLQVHKGVAIGKFDSRQAFNISAPETPKTGFAAVGTDNYGYIDLHQYLLQGPQTL